MSRVKVIDILTMLLDDSWYGSWCLIDIYIYILTAKFWPICFFLYLPALKHHLWPASRTSVRWPGRNELDVRRFVYTRSLSINIFDSTYLVTMCFDMIWYGWDHMVWMRLYDMSKTSRVWSSNMNHCKIINHHKIKNPPVGPTSSWYSDATVMSSSSEVFFPKIT